MKTLDLSQQIKQDIKKHVICLGEVHSNGSLSTVFFRWKGKDYMSQRSYGWVPKEPEHVTFTPESKGADPHRGTMPRLVRIIQTFYPGES